MVKPENQGEIASKGIYDVIVAGGGVAGVAAALAARREGKRVLLLEKSMMLGGLATLGNINLFVPMCNGRGKRIIYGMVSEFIKLSTKYGWGYIPRAWENGEPKEATSARYTVWFSPILFALALTEQVVTEGIDLYYDTIASHPVMADGRCKGIIVENKSGREFFEAKVIIDATGDGDVLHRAGVPMMDGVNFFTYLAKAIDLEHCKKAVESGKIEQAIFSVMGGSANLYGKNHPEGMEYFKGISSDLVNDYLIKNQMKLLDNIRDDNRSTREIVTLPLMAQFRKTRCIKGDYVLRETDTYRHFDDSVGVINDFEHPDFLFEVPYRTMVNSGFKNLLAAGRTVSAEKYAWDCLRVIPPAILTGQVAGIAASQAIDSQKSVDEINISVLQKKLQEQDVRIHFEDSLIPKGAKPGDTYERPIDNEVQNELI